jgi:hypothetical protein
MVLLVPNMHRQAWRGMDNCDLSLRDFTARADEKDGRIDFRRDALWIS